MALGLAWFLSALGVFIRDIGQVGSFLGLALLYSSGVFYSAENELRHRQSGNFFNGIHFFQIIDSLRQVILWEEHPDWLTMGYAWIFGFMTLFAGAWFFNRLRPAFADVL